MEVVTINNSNIKGYHYFKVRPHREIKMNVEKEVGNVRDESAMVIKMPPLQQISKSYHFDVTRPSKSPRERDQRVIDVAGNVVGRVPANLCRIFRRLLDCGDVDRIMWYVHS